MSTVATDPHVLTSTTNRPLFQIGEEVESRVLVTPYQRQELDDFLDHLEELGITEFAIDVVIIDGKLFLDSESRNFRRLRGWDMAQAGSNEMQTSLSIATGVYQKAVNELVENSKGKFFPSKYSRFTIELTYQPAGKRPRHYDSVPHLDALSAYKDFPVKEVLWSDDEPSIVWEGKRVWTDTTAEQVSVKGMRRLVLPSEHLTIGDGVLMVHNAPPTENERWLLRGFLEVITEKMATQCRYGFDNDLGLGLSFQSD